MVFRLGPGHGQQITARLQPPLRQPRRVGLPDRLGAVGDEAARRAARVALLHTRGNGLGVGNQARGRARGQPLHAAQVQARRCAPLAARPLQAIDVDPDRRAQRTRQPARPGRAIAQHIDQVVAPARVPQAGAVVRQSRGRPPVRSAALAHAHALVAAVGAGRAPFGLGIDGDLVATRCQPHGQLLGKGFKAAVARRDAARAQDGDAQSGRGRPRSRHGAGCAQRSASASSRPT